jgi:hypothetical protein
LETIGGKGELIVVVARFCKLWNMRWIEGYVFHEKTYFVLVMSSCKLYRVWITIILTQWHIQKNSSFCGLCCYHLLDLKWNSIIVSASTWTKYFYKWWDIYGRTWIFHLLKCKQFFSNDLVKQFSRSFIGLWRM